MRSTGRVLCAGFVLLCASGPTLADVCPWSGTPIPFSPGQFDLNVTGNTPLEYQRPIRVVNLFWTDRDWDSIPAHQPKLDANGNLARDSSGNIINSGLLRDDINQATYALIHSNFFDRTCQYGTGFGGGPSFDWYGDTVGGRGEGDCPANPPGTIFSRVDIFHVVACMEVNQKTGVPTAGGVAAADITGNAFCGGCGWLFQPPCYIDPKCLSFTNGTGDVLVNVFVPADSIDMQAIGSSNPIAWHGLVPSEAYSRGFLPLTIGTQGRAIYTAVYLLNRFGSADDVRTRLTHLIGHEMVEVLTDPLGGAFWYDQNVTDDLGESEVADVCQRKEAAAMPPISSGYGGDLTGTLHWHSNKLPASDADLTSTIKPYWSNADQYCINLDDDPPKTTATTDGKPGWNNTNVMVTLTSTDQPPTASAVGTASVTFAIGSQPALTIGSYTTSFLVTPEGTTAVHFHGTDKLGHVESDQSISVMIDRTPPIIFPVSLSSVLPGPTLFGWYNSAVTATFHCSDALSGIQSCTSAPLSTEGAAQYILGVATDNAGNTQGAQAGPVNIDLTAPVITYSGNQGTYDASDTVNITCQATDALSGVDTTTCTNIVGPAYAFGIQTSTFSSTAVDKAANRGNASVTFTVTVTPAGMQKLVSRFVANGGIAGSLNAKLDRVAAASDPAAKANAVSAFISELNGIRGKQISDGDADILVYLAGFL